jgi:molybdate transport system substrate-binding protein
MVYRLYYVALLLMVSLSSAQALELRIAVASNFVPAMQELAVQFYKTSNISVQISAGSSGKHYAQILNGAPYDVFLSADADKPMLLEQQGLAVVGTRFTYAIGRLVLWPSVPESQAAAEQLRGLAADMRIRLAIANPKLAPYGLAAQQSLERLQLWGDLKASIVKGENVAQTLQYVVSGNASAGFVARSQLVLLNKPSSGMWLVPAEMHEPINQQLIILRNTEAAVRFIEYVQSYAGKAIIRNYGYETP